MSITVQKLPHHCGSRQGLQVFADEETGKVNGFCFSCKTFVANPYGKEVSINDIELPESKSEKELQEELAEIPGLTTVDTPTRKLRASDLEEYNVKTALSEEDGKTPTHMYFPITKEGKTSGYYVKTLSSPSHQWSIGDVKSGDLFGWDKARSSGAYKLIITEGLEDAIALNKIYHRYGKEEYQPAIVSLPNGVMSVRKSLTKHSEYIRNTFKEVVFCFDDDEAGHKAVEEGMLILPQAKSVTLPFKDANECVIKGAMNQAYKAVSYNAVKPKNTRLIFGQDLHEAAREPTPYGELTWPYSKLNKLLRGIRYGETIYIGAGVKQGKSELVNDIGAHFIREHGVPVFMAKPEEENKKTYRLVCGKLVGRVFHDPDVEFDYEAYDKAGEMIKDKLMMINLYQHMGWSSLKDDIVAAAHHGAKAVFIDPITNLTSGMNPSDANTKLQEIARDLSTIAKDLSIVIFIFCHLKAPEGNISKDVRLKKYRDKQYVGLGNCPHEKGGDVLSNQFSGSRAMMQSCNLMLGLEGNRDEELPEEIRNTRWLRILEDREFGNSDSTRLYWNKNTTQFKEI